MARKLHMRRRLLAVMFAFVVFSTIGCANRRANVNASSALSSVGPSRLPATGVMADSARLSGVNSTGVSTPGTSASDVVRTSVDDSANSTYTRDSYGSGGPSSSGSSSRCGRCGG